jgi:hypothetical protein
MRTILLTLLLISLSSTLTFSQNQQLKISKDEILIPFGNTVMVQTTANGTTLSNFKLLDHSKITEVLDYNTAFDNVNLDNLSSKTIVFKFSKFKIFEQESIVLVTRSNLKHDFTFKVKVIFKDMEINGLEEITTDSKNPMIFNIADIEAIILHDFEIKAKNN